MGPFGSHVGRGFHPSFFSEASLFLYYWRGGHGHPHLGSAYIVSRFRADLQEFNRYFVPSNVRNLKNIDIEYTVYIYVLYAKYIHIDADACFFFKNTIAISPMKYILLHHLLS